MFFTKAGTALAWIMLVGGLLRTATGLYVGFNMDTPGFDPTRYLGSKTPGHAIDWGVAVALCGIALGILAEISKAARLSGPTRQN